MKDLTTILLAIVGVAVLAVLVSKRSNTTGVFNSASSAFNSGLATAEGPVTGYSPGPPIYATSGLGLFGAGGLGDVGSGFNTSGFGGG